MQQNTNVTKTNETNYKSKQTQVQQNTNGAKYKYNKIQMEQNTNRTKCKNLKYNRHIVGLPC